MIAISTAYKKALIGVDIEGAKAYKELDSNCKHSENILPSLDDTIAKTGKNFKDNDCFALVVGPGSFTGLRIGISLVKGFLAGGGEKKIVGVTTHELMAYTYIKKFQPSENFTCVVDALSGLYYVCEFSSQGEKLCEEKLIEREQLLNIKGKLIGLSEENVDEAAEKVEPSAEDLLELSLKKQLEGRFVRPEELKPLYLRKSQAEASLDKTK